MRSQIVRHLVEGGEEVGEDAGIRGGNRFVRLDNIKVHVAGVGVDYHFDRIANVVEAGRKGPCPDVGRLAVGESSADRVGVEEPVEMSVIANDDVGI